MTTSAQIRDALQTYVFDRGEIQSISTSVLFHEFSDASEVELSELYDGQQINAFQCLVRRSTAQMMTGAQQVIFTIDVSYFLQRGTDGDSWINAVDSLDTILNTLKSQLGSTWKGLIDYWVRNEDAPAIDEVDIAGEKAWKASLTIQAFGTELI